MATFYGSWVATDDFRTVLDATVTNSNTTSTVKLVVKCQSNYAYAGSSGRASCTCNGTTRNADHSIAQGATTTMMTETFSVARGTADKKITVKGKTWIVNTGIGSYGTGSTASGTVTIPALASYKVSYNANGGSGAPAAQTKWYGKSLTLSSTKPTRAGYSFQGWATSASGAVAYKPGTSYTGNAALTLYAVWKRDYIAPSITAASAYRVPSNTSTVESPTGGYAYASFTWKVDTTLTSGNAAKSVTVTYRAAGASAWSAATVGGTTTGSSGTVTGRFAAAVNTAYEVKVTVTDKSGQAGSTVELVRSIGVAAIPLQIRNRGRGVGILSAAPDEGLRLGGSNLYVGDGSYTMADLKALLDNVGYVSQKVTSFGSNFKAYSSSYPPTLQRHGPLVVLVGGVANTSSFAPSDSQVTMFTVPQGFRPAMVTRSLCQGSGKSSWLLQVNENGAVTISRYGKTGYETVPANAWLICAAVWMTDDPLP